MRCRPMPVRKESSWLAPIRVMSFITIHFTPWVVFEIVPDIVPTNDAERMFKAPGRGESCGSGQMFNTQHLRFDLRTGNQMPGKTQG